MKRKTKRRLARENPNWRLKVYDDKALLADNGPYVTQRGALVDAKELARRRAAVQGQRVVTIRTRAGRDSAYKTVDANGEATGFFAVPGAVPGTELRYNPKIRSMTSDARANRFRARLVTLEKRLRALGYADAQADHVKRIIAQLSYYAFRPQDLAPVEQEAKRTLAQHAEFFSGGAGRTRANPKSSPVPYLMLWAERNGGAFRQLQNGRVLATFPSAVAANAFVQELQTYGVSNITNMRGGYLPKGPYTYMVEGTLPALTNPKRRTARANHHLAPGQRAAGEVRVVKPLGMRGKADYYIVEGHRLRAEGARRNGAAPGVTSAEAYAHAQRHKAERDRYGKLTARTYTGGNIQSHEELGEWRHETAAKEWHKAARALDLVGNEAWPVHPRVVSEAVRQAEKASAAAAAADAAYLAARAEAERLKAKFAARKNGRRTR